MKLLLNCSCLDWCDGKVGENSCSSNRIAFVNSIGNSSFEVVDNVGRYYFVHNPTVRRRGVLEFEQFVSGPTPGSPVVMEPIVGTTRHM